MKYITPEMEIVDLQTQDVVCQSVPDMPTPPEEW